MFNFNLLNGAMQDANISDSQFRTLYLIVNNCSLNKSDSIEMFNAYIMGHLHISQSSVQRNIKALEDNGYISVVRAKHKGQANTIIIKGSKIDTLYNSKGIKNDTLNVKGSKIEVKNDTLYNSIDNNKNNNSNSNNSDMTTGLETQGERNVNLREVEEVDDVPFDFGIGEVLAISDGENNAVNSTDNISIEEETISEGTASESENIISEEVKETEPVKTISEVEVRNNPTAPNRIAISKAIELLPTFTKRIRDFKENCTVERQRAEKAIKFIADNRSCATAKQIEVLDKMIAEYRKATSDRDRCIGSDLAEVERQEANTIDCSKPTPSINTASVDYLISIGKRVTWKYDDMVEEAEKVAANTNLTGDELEKYVDNWIYYHTSAVAENVSKIYNNIMKQKISDLRATGAQNTDAA